MQAILPHVKEDASEDGTGTAQQPSGKPCGLCTDKPSGSQSLCAPETPAIDWKDLRVSSPAGLAPVRTRARAWSFSGARFVRRTSCLGSCRRRWAALLTTSEDGRARVLPSAARCPSAPAVDPDTPSPLRWGRRERPRLCRRRHRCGRQAAIATFHPPCTGQPWTQPPWASGCFEPFTH